VQSSIRAVRQFLSDIFKFGLVIGIILGGFTLYANYVVYDVPEASPNEAQPVKSFDANAAAPPLLHINEMQ